MNYKGFLILIIIITFGGGVSAQILLKQASTYVKGGSAIVGDASILDGEPKRIMVNNVFIDVKDVEYIENDYYRLRNIESDNTEELYIAVVEGDKLSLYRSSEEASKISYYLVYENKFIPLIGGNVWVERDSDTYNMSSKQYIGVLIHLAGERTDLLKNIENTRYSEKDLSKFVIEFNDNNNYVVNKKTEHRKLFTDFETSFIYANGRTKFESNNYEFEAKYSLYQLGFRSYIFQGGRSSIRLLVGLGNASSSVDNTNNLNYNFTRIQLGYLVDIYRTSVSDWYLSVGIDGVYIYESEDEIKDPFNLAKMPNIGLGYRYRALKNFNFFIEFNELGMNFYRKEIPKKFSLGIAWKF